MAQLQNKSILIILICVHSIFALSHHCSTIVSKLKQSKHEQQKIKLIQQISSFQCSTKIFPRYRWGQNMSHLLVKIQFSTSTQTTPCQELLYQNKTVNYQMFEVRVLCLHANKYLIDYHLQLRTFKSLDYTTAVWKKGQQNSIILQCLKSPAPYFWPVLHSRSIKPGRPPKVWWEILNRYGQELRPVIDTLQLGDQDIQVSRVIKKKKKKTKRKQYIQFYCNQGSPEHLASWL